jgi:hypothetical protein
MKKRTSAPDKDPARTDLVHANSFIWIWGLPVAVIIFANAAWDSHWLSLVTVGVLMTAATAWIGAACYFNGIRSGRTHCVIDGYLLPLLSIFGLLNVLRITSLSWPTYFNIFWLVIILGFSPECCGLKYLRRRSAGPGK